MKQGIQKAVVAIIGASITLLAAFTDIEPDAVEGFVEPAAAIITAALVYLVPNSQKPEKE